MRWLIILMACTPLASAAAEEVLTLQWESGVVALEPGDIAAVAADAENVAVVLEESIARKFAAVTELLIGETMAVLVCGREVARPVIMAPIEGGHLLVPVGPQSEAAAEVLQGRLPCEALAN